MSCTESSKTCDLMRHAPSTAATKAIPLRLAVCCLQVAFMAASGGASVAAQATGAAARNLPPSLQILQDEIDDLRAAEKGLRMRSRKLQLGAGAGAVGWIVLFLCPFLWNKATYIVCAQGVGHAFTYMTMADTLRTGLRGSIKYPIVQQV
eukprot:986669-Pleurochrysis_carterae.AAC.1